MSFSKYPFIQKPHLFLRVEPVLTAFHDGESGIVLLCKIADGFKWRQVVTASIEDLRRRRPTDGMASHIAEVIPRQVLAERGMDGSLGFQFRFRDIAPPHHIGDQLLHIHDG